MERSPKLHNDYRKYFNKHTIESTVERRQREFTEAGHLIWQTPAPEKDVAFFQTLVATSDAVEAKPGGYCKFGVSEDGKIVVLIYYGMACDQRYRQHRHTQSMLGFIPRQALHDLAVEHDIHLHTSPPSYSDNPPLGYMEITESSFIVQDCTITSNVYYKSHLDFARIWKPHNTQPPAGVSGMNKEPSVKRPAHRPHDRFCDDCQKQFTDLEAYRAHAQEAHSGDEWVCSVGACKGRKFNDISQLQRHLENCHSKVKRLYQCDECYWTTSNGQQFDVHMEARHSRNEYRCKYHAQGYILASLQDSSKSCTLPRAVAMQVSASAHQGRCRVRALSARRL